MTLVEAYIAYQEGADIEVSVEIIGKFGKQSFVLSDKFAISHNTVFPKNGNFNDFHICDSEDDFWEYYYSPSFKEQWIVNTGFIKDDSSCKYVYSYAPYYEYSNRPNYEFLGKQYPEKFDWPILLEELPF